MQGVIIHTTENMQQLLSHSISVHPCVNIMKLKLTVTDPFSSGVKYIKFQITLFSMRELSQICLQGKVLDTL